MTISTTINVIGPPGAGSYFIVGIIFDLLTPGSGMDLIVDYNEYSKTYPPLVEQLHANDIASIAELKKSINIFIVVDDDIALMICQLLVIYKHNLVLGPNHYKSVMEATDPFHTLLDDETRANYNNTQVYAEEVLAMNPNHTLILDYNKLLIECSDDEIDKLQQFIARKGLDVEDLCVFKSQIKDYSTRNKEIINTLYIDVYNEPYFNI